MSRAKSRASKPARSPDASIQSVPDRLRPLLAQALQAAGAMGILLYSALAVVPTFARRAWDFETYWYAVKAAMHGMNPYDAGVLATLAGRPLGMPFLYSPVTLPLFMPLTLLTIDQAATAWFGIQFFLLVPLVLLWRRYFVPGVSIVVLAVLTVLGFNGALIWDLRAGNVAVLEALLLWIGFAAYVRGRRRLFAGCVIAASLFKLSPVLFLAFLLIPTGSSGPRWRLACMALAAFFLVAFGPTVAGFSWARDFLRGLPSERPWGLVNPSALGFIDTMLDDHVTPLATPPFRALTLWILYVVGLLALSALRLRSLWVRRDPREWIFAGTILYGLLVPRMMVYSYLLILAPVLGLIAPIVSRFGGPWTVTAVVGSQALLIPLLNLDYRNPWIENLSFFTLLGLWLVYLAAPTKVRGSA